MLREKWYERGGPQEYDGVLFRRGLAPSTQAKKKGEPVEETYEVFQLGMSLDDIAKLFRLWSSTIASRMKRLVRDGRDIDMARLVDPRKRTRIEEFFLSVKAWEPILLWNISKRTVNYEEARLVRAYLLSNHKE